MVKSNNKSNEVISSLKDEISHSQNRQQMLKLKTAVRVDLEHGAYLKITLRVRVDRDEHGVARIHARAAS